MGLFQMNRRADRGVETNASRQNAFVRFFDILFRKFRGFLLSNAVLLLVGSPVLLVVYLLAVFVVENAMLPIQNEASVMEIRFYAMVGKFMLCNLYLSLWGIGPATAGVTCIMRNYAGESHAWVWSDFKDTVKANYKQALAVLTVDLLVACVFYLAFEVYAQQNGVMGMMKYVICLLAFVYTLMHLYMYPLMVTFSMSLRDIYINSLLFAIGKLPSSILTLLLLIGLHIGVPVAIMTFGGAGFVRILFIYFGLELFLLQALSAFVVNFNAYPKLKKYLPDQEKTLSE